MLALRARPVAHRMTTADRDRGKAHERRVARRLGGERVPSPGRERGYAPDVRHPRWSIECKAWAKVPHYLSDAMDQAVRSVRGAQVPVVILHVKGQRSDNDYVVMRMKEWEAAVGGSDLPSGMGEDGVVGRLVQ